MLLDFLYDAFLQFRPKQNPRYWMNIFRIHGGTLFPNDCLKCMFRTKTVISSDRATRLIKDAIYIPEISKVVTNKNLTFKIVTFHFWRCICMRAWTTRLHADVKRYSSYSSIFILIFMFLSFLSKFSVVKIDGLYQDSSRHCSHSWGNENYYNW